MRICKRILILFFIFSLECFSQNTWKKVASCGGSKRERAAGFGIANKGYIGTGLDTLKNMLKDFWEYDTLANVWTQLANFGGVGRRDAVGFSIGNFGYIGTGIDNADSKIGNTLDDFWQYDPSMNSWTQKANYPGNTGGGVYYATAFEAGGNGYICGGKAGSSTYLNELWQYNPTANSWSKKANFPPGNRYGLTSFSVNGKGYVGTGADENLFQNDLWEYDPGNNSWMQKSSLPSSPRFSCTGFALGMKGYIVLGTDGGMRTDLFEYNPTTDSWTIRAPYPGVARRSAPAFVVGNKAFVGTGNSDQGVRKDMYVYTPLAPTGVEEFQEENFISVFPNPLRTFAEVKILKNNFQPPFEFSVFDLSGRKIISMENISAETFQISLEGISPGIYLYKLSSEKKIIGTGKIIVE